MSTKVSKSNATKTVAAKAQSKTTSVRLSEDDKKSDPENYILNPATKKHVKRDSPMGKKLVKAEETGEEVAKTMTETQRLILVIQTLQDQLGLDDSAIKAALTTDETVKSELPRSFPSIWGGKQKTARHADHPKQPSNPFIFFCKAVRASVVGANPGVKNTEVISIMGKMWKDTPEDARAEYNDLAAADKTRYEEAMKIFEAEHPEEARSKTSPGTGKPTKETAYHLFSEEHRESVQTEFPDLDGKQITKKLAEMWDEMKKSDKDKVAEYQSAADQANEGFEERVAEFNSSPGSSPKLSKAEQAKADDPEHYELNLKTNRYKLKDDWKRNPDGSFVLASKKDAASPKKPAAKPAAKAAVKKIERPAAKVAKAKIEQITEAEDDDDLLVA
jgi:hypothetical protein